MSFRLTKGKVIGSIIVPVIVWILVFTLKLKPNAPTIIQNFFALHDLTNLFSKGNIYLFIIEVVVIYIILSIFQSNHPLPNAPNLRR